MWGVGLFDTKSHIDPPYYSLRKNIFDTIQIDIQTANGQPAPFKSGNTVVTLQLSRKSQRHPLPAFISYLSQHGGPSQ